MVRMLIVRYCMGIRSERRLCEEVHLNLAYRWFCRLGLDGKVPDHSTFSKNRHGRFRESDALRHLFESVVQRCMAEGLVGGDGFAVDASLIAADANKQRSVPSKDWKPEEIKDNAVRAAREYLATLDDAAFGAASPVTPKFVSRSDPAAQWTGAQGACLLRLCRQLSDRYRPRGDCRRRGDAGHSAGRGRGAQASFEPA
jgi:IS5 family transposase